MTDKEAYCIWCQTQVDLPVFLQPWWLDAVCINKEWRIALFQSNGIVQAAMPYLIRKRLWIRYILMPQQTQIGGVWITDRQCSLVEIQQLPRQVDKAIRRLRLGYYYQHFPINSPIPLAMRDLGYTVSERVTYRINDCSDVEKVISRYNRNKQRQLRKSQQYIAREDILSAEQLFDFHQCALQAQGKVISYSKELLLTLVNSAITHQQGTIVSLHLPSETPQEPIAAAFYVWDNDSVHYLIAAQHPDYTDCGLMARLVTEGIRLAHKRNIAFDFEGSMIPGVAKHFQQFGATPTAYYSVERFFNPSFRLLYRIYQFITRKKR